MKKNLINFFLIIIITGCNNSSSERNISMPNNKNSNEESWNMSLVGSNNLQGRSAYHAVPHRYDDRYILFVGHHSGEKVNSLNGKVETNGMSILDITNPSKPTYLHNQPPSEGAENRQHVQVCNGNDLPNANPEKVYLINTNGSLGAELLDVSDPEKPQIIGMIYYTGTTDQGGKQTHKIYWDCESGIAYLNGTPEGWRIRRVLQLFDMSNPLEPKHIRNFALDGSQPGAEGPIGTPLHAPFAFGDRVYLGYGASDDGVMQILDRDKLINGDPESSEPFKPTKENLLYPQISRLDMPEYYGAHSVKPLFNLEVKDFVDTEKNKFLNLALLASEEIGIGNCSTDRDMLFIVDITDEDKPFPISSFQAKEDLGNFCERGLRFGLHSVNDNYHPNFDNSLVIMSYFNGGTRVADIRDPFNPVEVAYFVPQINDFTQEICSNEECFRQIQTNNVDIDDRGFIFSVDRAGSGLHILELTGEAKKIAGL
ncbi:MAG: hypothetical protein CMQ51_07845 [Gammaproteobacteria bacterium]|nr:hypothetical protein [Gammaproteobacteria bacterium]